MSTIKCLSVLLLLSAVVCGQQERLLTSEDLLSTIVEDCAVGDQSVTTCIRHNVLSYMNNILGVTDERTGRKMNDESLDEQIAVRVTKYINTHEFQLQLPEFLFQKALLTFRPSRGLANFKVDFPEYNEARSDNEARDMLKKKLLLPVLLLLKLKMKALIPIMLMIIGIKAFKALVMSKIALLMVTGFLIVQLCKKLGMPMPMPMPMPAAIATELPPVYGPGPTPAPYGVPAAPDNSYGPWDSSSSNGASNSGSYQRWDAHNVAYNSYQPDTKSPTKSS